MYKNLDIEKKNLFQLNKSLHKYGAVFHYNICGSEIFII